MQQQLVAAAVAVVEPTISRYDTRPQKKNVTKKQMTLVVVVVVIFPCFEEEEGEDKIDFFFW